MKATTKCKACKQLVAKEALICPSCGCELPGKSVRCPDCGSKKVGVTQRGYSFLAGAAAAGLGALMFGPAGLLAGAAGFKGRDKLRYVCHACGAKWAIEK